MIAAPRGLRVITSAFLAVAGGGWPVGAQPEPPPPSSDRVEVRGYELTLDLPDTGRVIDGRAVLTVRHRRSLDTLVLDFVGMQVDSVLVGGRPAAFSRGPATLRVPLPESAAPGDTLRVAVRYHGPPTDGLIISTDPLGRWQAFGDNWPDRARHWIPSVDHPSDKATVTWIVRAPSDRTVVANGDLIEEIRLAPRAGHGPRTVTRWRSSRPIPVYAMVIAAAPLAYVDLGESACGQREGGGCVRQSVYVAPEVRSFLPGPFARAGDIVSYFASLVGDFPYEKLAHLESATRFGGMENASAIFYADGPFRTRTMGAGVIAHETAHQWFGDAVTEREWGHLWLSEGFATYFEQLWWRHADGDSAFAARMARLRSEVVTARAVASRPVVDTAETQYLRLLNANSYQKGAWVLHMLRASLGDSAFFPGVRAYVARYRHRTALTDDLRAELERSSGVDLAWFFDQWLRRPGFPELATRWRYDGRAGRVTLDVVQASRFGPYRFPLTVLVERGDGSAERVRVEVPASPRTSLVLPLVLPHLPKHVALDPDVELLATFAQL